MRSQKRIDDSNKINIIDIMLVGRLATQAKITELLCSQQSNYTYTISITCQPYNDYYRN